MDLYSPENISFWRQFNQYVEENPELIELSDIAERFYAPEVPDDVVSKFILLDIVHNQTIDLTKDHVMTSKFDEWVEWHKINEPNPELWNREKDFYFELFTYTTEDDVSETDYEKYMDNVKQEYNKNFEKNCKKHCCIFCKRYLRSQCGGNTLEFHHGKFMIYSGFDGLHDSMKLTLNDKYYYYDSGKIKLGESIDPLIFESNYSILSNKTLHLCSSPDSLICQSLCPSLTGFVCSRCCLDIIKLNQIIKYIIS